MNNETQTLAEFHTERANKWEEHLKTTTDRQVWAQTVALIDFHRAEAEHWAMAERWAGWHE